MRQSRKNKETDLRSEKSLRNCQHRYSTERAKRASFSRFRKIIIKLFVERK